MSSRGIDAYRKVFIESAPKPRVLDELYLRLLRDLEEMARCIEGKDLLGKAEKSSHALAIVTELIAALDHAQAPELCQNLERLYDFAAARILDSSTRLDPKPLDEAAKVVRTLRESFLEAQAQS